MKICTMCHKLKKLTAFAKHKKGLNGRTSRCLECRRIEFKNWTKKVAKHGGLLTPTDIERFNNFIEKPDAPDACWIWKGGRVKTGYGRFYVNGKHIYAHRYSYEIHIGKIPPNKIVLHSCDNPPCVNPKHLSLGSHQDNSFDMVKKTRQSCHEKNSHSVLTEKDVINIRNSYPRKSTIFLAQKFNVTRGTIYHILNKHTWKYV